MSTSHIRLSDGQLFDPFQATANTPRPPRQVFTRALSMLNRYTGHSLYPYSVAAHSVVLCGSVEVQEAGLMRAALLHDFSEAMMNDLASPIKAALPAYQEKEEALQRTIFEWWGEPWKNMTELMQYDKRICVNEMTVLFPETRQTWAEPLQAYVLPETPWREVFEIFEDACDMYGVAA